MLVLFIFIWIRSQRTGSSFVCLKPGQVAGGPTELSPLGRFWLGGVPVQALSRAVGKGQGSGFKSRSRPSPGQQMTYRTKSPSIGGSPLQEGRRRERAGPPSRRTSDLEYAGCLDWECLWGEVPTGLPAAEHGVGAEWGTGASQTATQQCHLHYQELP